MPERDLLIADNFHPDVWEQAETYGRYAMYSVFGITRGVLPADRTQVAEELVRFLIQCHDRGVVVRGIYDLAGMRADGDVLLWWHAQDLEQIQDAYREFLANTEFGRACDPVWSAAGVHRPTEFENTHVPSFVGGHSPDKWLSIHPFSRSYEWYVLAPEERARMLRDHGMQAVGYEDIHASTTAAFGMGDYEWLMAFEAPKLERITNMLLKMRYVEARTHVRLESPMYSGRLVSSSTEDLLEFLHTLR